MARFYGWNDFEINAMPYPVYIKYYKSIEPLEAAETLSKFNEASFPHIKSNKRKEAVAKLNRVYNKVITSGNEKLADFDNVMTTMKGFMQSGRR